MRSILIESLPSQFSEASSTDFDMILSCPKSSLVFTPTVTFKFTEILSGSNCTAINESNGGPQNIGFAFKNGVTRICGTTTNGGVNALTFPTSTLDTAYSQSKKISVAYTRTSSAAVTAGAVISTVTFTTSYQ
jgi:type 1 fimbria pilin